MKNSKTNQKRNILQIIKIYSVLLLIVLTINQSEAIVNASNQVSVNVTPVVQGYSFWCWAACAEMTGSIISTNGHRIQSALVYYIHHSYGNYGATISETALAAKYSGYGKKNVTGESNIKYISFLWNKISDGYPVVAGCFSYNASGNITGSGHAVEIHKIRYVTNNSGNVYYITYIDPLYGEEEEVPYIDFIMRNNNRYVQTAYVD